MGQKKPKRKKPGDRTEENRSQIDKGTESDESSVVLTEGQKSMRRVIIYVSLLAVLLTAWGGYNLFLYSKRETLADKCEAFKTRGEWASLELTAREWAQWEPDNVKPWIYAAAAAQEVGNAEKELAYLNSMPEGAPFAALLRRSDLQFQRNFVKDAEKSFVELVELEPQSKEAHRRLNFFYAMTRQRNELISESRRAIENGADVPETYVYLVGADWMTFTNGWQVNLEWAQKYPDDSEVFEVASALHLISAGVDQSMEEQDAKLKEALSQSENLIKNLRLKYPANKEIILLDLMYNVHRANAREVGEILNSVDIEIDDSRYHRVIGWFHSYKEDWVEAEKSYLKCLELNPFDWQARHEYSAVLRSLKRTEEVKVMQEAAALGKDIMRKVLQAENTITIPRSTLQQVIDYATACGETEIATSLSNRINPNVE